MTKGQLIGALYDCSPEILLRIAVDIKEHPEKSREKYADINGVKFALEKVLDIRAVERGAVRKYYYGVPYGPIQNSAQLRETYSILRFLDNACGTGKISAKCAIRRYVHQPESNRRIVKDEGMDGYIELVKLPTFHFESKEDAVEYFDQHYWIDMRPSAYDCTGQAFTKWAHLFQRHGMWYAYHAVGFDV